MRAFSCRPVRRDWSFGQSGPPERGVSVPGAYFGETQKWLTPSGVGVARAPRKGQTRHT